MFVIVWKYEVPAASDEEFRLAYGPDGDWARLFAGQEGFVGTELIANDASRHYLTIDRWESADAFNSFMEKNRNEYQRLDDRFAALTVTEELLGRGGNAGH